MKQFLSKRINLIGFVTLIFAIIFVLVVYVIPTIIYNNNLDKLKSHLQYLTLNYEDITEVESTERLYVYEDGISELLIDAGTIYDIDTDIEVHLIHWSHDQSVPEAFYEDDFQSRNFVYYIRVIADEHYVVAFADTSDLIEFVDNFVIYSIAIVLGLYLITLVFSSTFLSSNLIKKYSFFDPVSVLNSKIAFLHNYDKKNLGEKQITYHSINNINDIIDKLGFTNTNGIHLLIKQKLMNSYKFENVYQLSNSEFIIVCDDSSDAHLAFHTAINAQSTNGNLIAYEFKVKTVIVDKEVVSTLDAVTLINRIQYALFNAKGDKGDVTFVDKELFEKLNQELYYQSHLQAAIDNKELVNYYQIKINPKTKLAIGAEALSRWIKDGKVISPGKYIHLAEASGLIYNIDLLSFENTCKSIAILQEDKNLPENFRLSTNFSPLTLKNVTLETLEEIIKTTKADPHRISVEVTESVSLEFDKIKKILDDMVELGMNIEIDDFSAGNSSFTVLPLINASTVKLDMAVLPENLESRNEVMIYDSLIAITRQLDIKIISEGVETKEQVDYLTTRDIDGIQGYYYSKPVAFDEFVKLLSKFS